MHFAFVDHDFLPAAQVRKRVGRRGGRGGGGLERGGFGRRFLNFFFINFFIQIDNEREGPVVE